MNYKVINVTKTARFTFVRNHRHQINTAAESLKERIPEEIVLDEASVRRVTFPRSDSHLPSEQQNKSDVSSSFLFASPDRTGDGKSSGSDESQARGFVGECLSANSRDVGAPREEIPGSEEAAALVGPPQSPSSCAKSLAADDVSSFSLLLRQSILCRMNLTMSFKRNSFRHSPHVSRSF